MSEYLLPVIVTLGWIYLAYAINPVRTAIKEYFHFAVLLNIMANVMLFWLSGKSSTGVEEFLNIYMYFNLFIGISYLLMYVIFNIFKPLRALISKDEKLEDFSN